MVFNRYELLELESGTEAHRDRCLWQELPVWRRVDDVKGFQSNDDPDDRLVVRYEPEGLVLELDQPGRGVDLPDRLAEATAHGCCSLVAADSPGLRGSAG